MADKQFDFKLEQYYLDELSPNIQIDKDSKETKEYIDYIERDNEEFFQKFDIKALSAKAEELSKEKKIIKFPTKIITSLAAAACFIMVLNFIPKSEDKEIIYLKGRQVINVYKRIDDEVIKLRNRDKVKEWDQLQITYRTGNSYGLIFSIDGLNNITFHYPEEENSPTNLDIGKEVTLPSSYTLDNAPYFETFYLITTDKGFNMREVKEAIYSLEVEDGKIKDELDLPSAYKIDKIILIKE